MFDSLVTFAPRFRVKNDMLAEFRNLVDKQSMMLDPFARYSHFGYDGLFGLGREGYDTFDRAIAGLTAARDVRKSMDAMLDDMKIEVHGMEKDIEAMKEYAKKEGKDTHFEYYVLDGKGTRKGVPDKDAVSLSTYFTVKDVAKFDELRKEFYEASKDETDDVYHGFSYSDNKVHCREGYKSAEALQKHLDNVKGVLEKVEKDENCKLEKLECQGPSAELDKLKAVLEPRGCKFYITN